MDERGAWEQDVDSISVLRDIALELLNEQTRTPALVAIDGNTSDGHHTFNELYEFRKVYNAALFNEWAAVGKCSVHKSWRHYDGELCFGGGWFIVVAVLPAGQISNHYEAKDWDLFAVPEAERALFEFDGHTGANVVARLKSYTAQPTMAEVCCGKYDTCAKACTPKGRFLEHREAAAQTAVPKGYKLVPVEPTSEMLVAMHNTARNSKAITWEIDAYAAMLATAPTPPAAQPAPVQEPVALDRVGIQKLLAQSGYDSANAQEKAAFISGIRHRAAEVLYTTPPAAQPAPVQEPVALPKGEWPKHPSPYVNDEYRGYLKSDLDDYAMQVLAVHGIKGNT